MASQAYNIPPIVKMKTSDSTGYVIETINHTTMGPGGCVRVTTREIWKLTATALSSGDIIAQVGPQTQLQNTKNEWITGFGENEGQADTQGCRVCMSPRTLNISTSNKNVNWFEQFSRFEPTNTEKRVTVMEDVSCETITPKTVDAQSQTDVAKQNANDEISSNINNNDKPSLEGSIDAIDKNSCQSVSTQVSSAEEENKSVNSLPSKQQRNCMSQTDLTGSNYNCQGCQDKAQISSKNKTTKREKNTHKSDDERSPDKNVDETKVKTKSERDSKIKRNEKKKTNKKDSDDNQKSNKRSKNSSKKKSKECNSIGNDSTDTSESSTDCDSSDN